MTLSSPEKGEASSVRLGGVGVTGSNLFDAIVKRVVAATMAKWGELCSGQATGREPRVPIIETKEEGWHREMEACIQLAVRLPRLVTAIMRAQKLGIIINTSTFTAFWPDPVSPTLGVFRAGLAKYARLFADKYAAENIRMINVLPKFIDSLP